ncbi:hypothetical protein Ancab_002061 [Ancistrocladus abbreviatus]
MDAPTSVPSGTASVVKNASDVDLFADVDFVSATPKAGAGSNALNKPNINLFAAETASSAPVSSTFDFFATSTPDVQPEISGLNKFDGSDLFGTFTSHTVSSSSEPIQNPVNGAGTIDTSNKSVTKTKAARKKDTFKVKSGM